MLCLRRSLRFLILLAALAGAVPAHADDRLDLFLRGFDEMALWHDNRTPVAVRKWRQPLRVRLAGAMASTYDGLVMGNLNRMAELAGLAVQRTEAGAGNENFLVQFDESSGYQVGGRSAGCMAQTTTASTGEISRVVLSINLQMGDLRHCVVHELLHAFGFPGHPHGLNTVLSYVYRGDRLSEIDEMSLRVLYDIRVSPGMLHLPALLVARQAIAERLGLVAAGGDASALGHRHFASALRYLNEEAEKGNPFVQMQLGNAYFFGQYVERDESRGVAWWRRAAEEGHLGAQVFLGYAATNSRDLPHSDEEAVLWYRRAADRGHALALNNLGLLYRDGRGVARDPVMAYMLLSVSGQRGYKSAEEHRKKLAATMTAEQVAEGDRRVAAWKPQQ